MDLQKMSTLDLHHYTSSTNEIDETQSSDANERIDITSQKYLKQALTIVETELGQDDVDLSKTINNAIESVASYVPEIEEERVKKFMNNTESLYYTPEDWKVNTNEISKLCEDCKEAQFDVSVNVVGMLFDLYGVPHKVAIKAARTLVSNMPAAAKVKLASISAIYFSNPANLIKVSKGLKILSELIIDVFGDIGTVLQVALSEYDRKDIVMISANVALNTSLLFATGGTALAIKLTLKTKSLYDLSASILHMKKVCGEHKKLLISLKSRDDDSISIQTPMEGIVQSKHDNDSLDDYD